MNGKKHGLWYWLLIGWWWDSLKLFFKLCWYLLKGCFSLISVLFSKAQEKREIAAPSTSQKSPQETIQERDAKIAQAKSLSQHTINPRPPQELEIGLSNYERWKTHYVVLDVETTGLDPETDEVIEIALIQFTDGIESGRYSTFVKPSKPIPNSITEITGISDNDVKDAPLPIEIGDKVVEIIRNRTIVAHNAEFDASFLYRMLDNIGMAITIEYLDTIPFAKNAYPGLPNYKLSTLIRYLHLADHEQTHRAMDDAECTAKLFAASKNVPMKKRSTTSKKSMPYDFADMAVTMKSAKQPVCVDSNSPLCGKTFVITGTLNISRQEAMQAIVNAGGFYRTAVSGKTDYLVVGQTEYDLVGNDMISSKEERAYKLIEEKGVNIKIINEHEFMELLRQ